MTRDFLISSLLFIFVYQRKQPNMQAYTFLEKLTEEGEEILIIELQKMWIGDKYLPRYFDGIISSDQGDRAITSTEELDSDQYWTLDTLWFPISKIDYISRNFIK